MSEQEDSWLMPTPFGVLHAFSSPQPDPMQQALQGLLASGGSLSLAQWRDALAETADGLLEEARNQNWVQLLKRSVPAPEVRLDDFARHVIAPLSSENCAALASDSGFCLGQAGLSGEEAELLAAACADFSGFAQRQARRGWNGAQRYVSFFSEPQMLLPEWSFVPLWVDGAGYWLILRGEPLLNNLAVVELVWSIRLAASRFSVPE